jgi:phosphoribosylglycinamide formyltransferase-1
LPKSFFSGILLEAMKPKLIIFASGTATGGGSGFLNLLKSARGGTLNADIVGVVSNHENGGVRRGAHVNGVRFFHFPSPWTAEAYQRIARESGAEFFALSGWLKLVTGLDVSTSFNSKTVFNIHPGPLPDFGGPGLYGINVHRAVIKALEEGRVDHSAVSMHFVTKQYDQGPVFLDHHVSVDHLDTPETLQRRVSGVEHLVQPLITDLVVSGKINWDGADPSSLRVTDGYQITRRLIATR